jgi:hypothetical protein
MALLTYNLVNYLQDEQGNEQGWIVRPRSVAELNGLIESALRQSPNITMAGNMVYLTMSNG